MDYSFLKGKIVERLGSQEKFAKELGISKQCLSVKLTNKGSFTQTQMAKIIKILNLNETELKLCFFTEN